MNQSCKTCFEIVYVVKRGLELTADFWFSLKIHWGPYLRFSSFLDPMEEDILQVVKYCTDLIEEKDLEKLDLVIKYMKR